MPRFFFHLRDDLNVEDDEGVDLPNTGAAEIEAKAGLLSVACEQMHSGYLDLNTRLEVTGEAGEPVLEVVLKDMIDIR